MGWDALVRLIVAAGHRCGSLRVARIPALKGSQAELDRPISTSATAHCLLIGLVLFLGPGGLGDCNGTGSQSFRPAVRFCAAN